MEIGFKYKMNVDEDDTTDKEVDNTDGNIESDGDDSDD